MNIKLKVYHPHPPTFRDYLAGEVSHMPDPWPDGEPVIIQIPGSAMLPVFGFLKDAKVRFKVLDSDGPAREWSPDRRDWVESVWDD